MWSRSVLVVVLLSPLLPGLSRGQTSEELARFQGDWKVTRLVDDGVVFSATDIASRLPSGGQFHIQGKKMEFVSPHDFKKYYRAFTLDETCYPKGIDIFSDKQTVSKGIYQFDNKKLVICLSTPGITSRPKEFAAEKNTRQVLLVLEPISTPKQPPVVAAKPPIPVPVANPNPTSAERIKKLLPGVWKHRDDKGDLFVTFNENGTFSTIREFKDFMVFKKVFEGKPMSSGTWSVDGQVLLLKITASSDSKKVNQVFSERISEIDNTHVIYVDQFGRVSRDERIR